MLIFKKLSSHMVPLVNPLACNISCLYRWWPFNCLSHGSLIKLL